MTDVDSDEKTGADVIHFLSRDDILTVEDRQYEVVEVPEWGKNGVPAAVRVRGLTGAERDSWESSMLKEDGKRQRMDYTNLRAKLIVHSIVDGEGRRLFAERDAALLGNKSATALQRLFDVCRRLSGLTNEDVEELTGNSKGEVNDDNGSTSRITSESP